ncbi:MAG: ABC transporter substrate-binding protein [Lachnospiraceae bacterium]|nr:ABC transporter substrate-binding protein [Lachnospiraceae bacterium]
MSIFRKAAALFMTAAVFIMLTACSRDTVTVGENEAKSRPVVGFSQLGAESDWRNANTQSMKENISEENGYDLIFDDGQQKQTNQIMAIRKFIQQEVDYIVLAPVTEEGWDTVLEEAKDAGIPVIIVDRMVNVGDESLFTAWVGSDFELEARKLTAWMNEFFGVSDIDGSDINIVNIQGNIGASAQIGRTQGLRKACEQYGWNLLDEVSGEFTQAKGREVMEMFLKKYDNINIVYCENDNEAIGAIEAIEGAGKEVGTDIRNGQIMVVSFDGVGKTALELAKQGKISCIAECNPLHGPRVKAIIDALELGLVPEKLEYVPEELFSADKTVTSYILDGKVYTVTELE